LEKSKLELEAVNDSVMIQLEEQLGKVQVMVVKAITNFTCLYIPLLCCCYVQYRT